MIGIYEITIKASKANSKSYIGKSMDIENRLRSHKRVLKKGNHICKELQKDYNSFSNDCKFDIVEKCKEEEIDKREQYWIKKRKTVEWGYNKYHRPLKRRNNKQKAIFLEPDLFDKLEKEAKKQKRSMSNLMVKILSEKMENNK